MIEQDSIRLLRECGVGAQMGALSLDEMYGRISSETFREYLAMSVEEHEKLAAETDELLCEYQDSGKEPSLYLRFISRAKTALALAMDESDATVAALVSDGCAAGIKTLSRFLNRYGAADERSKSLVRRLIGAEEKLAADIRRFL